MVATCLAASVAAIASFSAPEAAPAVDNVIVVMSDGLRWQEIFDGPDINLARTMRDRGASRYNSFRLDQRRMRLAPFLWGVVARQGQLYGNRMRGSVSKALNTMKISYPGYQETLCGFPDPSIQANANVPNPNVSVLEWLNRKPSFKGKVAAFAAWRVINGVLNKDRCGFLVNAGFDSWDWPVSSPVIQTIAQMKSAQTRYWKDEPSDVFAAQLCIEYMKLAQPRVIFLSLGETDAWAHENRYGMYLEAIHGFDRVLRKVWDTAQSLRAYRGRTALIVTTDHGRGDGAAWSNHGITMPNSEYTWQAYMGPGIPALGEINNGPTITNGQVAATVARLLGYDYSTFEPRAAPPVRSVVGG